MPDEARPSTAQVREEWKDLTSAGTAPIIDTTNVSRDDASNAVTSKSVPDAETADINTNLLSAEADDEALDRTMVQSQEGHAGNSSTSQTYAASNAALSPISPSQSRSQPPSTQTSSSSLQTLEHQRSLQSLRRGASQRSGSARSQSRNTMPSHQKSSSTSNPRPRVQHPVYPDQSFASLQYIGRRPSPVVRSNSTNPYQNTLHTGMSPSANRQTDSSTGLTLQTMSGTASSSPGLFSPTAYRPPPSGSVDGSMSPRLHGLQDLGAPRETTKAEVDRDMFTGLKTINYYEVLREIGRGRQGKVKFARNLQYENPDGSEVYCAIKIVPRASGRRRLGRIAEPTTDVKREIAILKKARHPNVVGLYEVIDDPEYKKVYLILEYVQRGEIVWRTHAPDSIININNRRWQLEKAGKELTTEVEDQDLHKVQTDWKNHTDAGRRFEHGMSMQTPRGDHFYANSETDEESSGISRSFSGGKMHSAGALSRANSHDDYAKQYDEATEGTYYGSYHDISTDLHRNISTDLHHLDRRGSLAFSAVSHMSSEHEGLVPNEQEAYVPTLTFAEARRSFQNVLLGLEFLHHIGIIHRDIKPANLLVSRWGEVKISDFGVSYLGKPLTEEEADNQVKKEEAGESEEVVGDDRELAKSVGTPAFWAPELCYDDTSIFADNQPPKITGALDIWSLGVTLYCMIYARLPFYADDEMGLHEAICTADPFFPATRLVAVEDDSPSADGSTNSNKRSKYELKFEYVPEAVRDLMRKLLVKDPSKRMTVKQAKLHPWVIEGLQDPTKFLERTDLPEEGKEKLAKEAEKDIDAAVKTIGAFRQAVVNVRSVVGSIAKGLTGRKSRGTSVATSASGSSESIAAASGSSGSTVGRQDRSRESRRRSLKPDEMAIVLKASRENTGEHPLAQSQTASPNQATGPSYFPESASYVKASTTAVTPFTEFSQRPAMPERAISSMSTAESVKTIRAPQPSQRASILDHQDSVKATLDGVSNTFSTFWEGATHHLTGRRDRDRSSTRDSRSPSASRESMESDAHTRPSVALSTLNASADLATPERLRRESPRSDRKSPTPFARSYGGRRQSVMVPTSSDAAFQEAHEVNQRKQISEITQHDPESRFKSPENPTEDECPPSPDDITFLRAMSSSRAEQRQATSSTEPQDHGSPIQTLPSASTIASSTDDPYSYSSNVSQRISNPSLGFGSGASSPPEEPDLPSDKESCPAHGPDNEADYMRTAEYMHTAEFIPERGSHTRPAAIGKSLEQQARDDDADDDHIAYDEDDDSSDDDGIMMGGGMTRK